MSVVRTTLRTFWKWPLHSAGTAAAAPLKHCVSIVQRLRLGVEWTYVWSHFPATCRMTSTFPAAVIFDMDGLLIDSERAWREAFFIAAADLGYQFSQEDFLNLVGRPWAANRITLRDRIGLACKADHIQSIWVRCHNDLKDTIGLKFGAIELLDLLEDLRIPRAICTSSDRQEVLYYLDRHDLRGRFDTIVAAGDYTRGKPAPDPFLRAAEVLGVKPETCLALEDSYNGVRAAAAAGMRTIMIPDLLPATDEMRALCHLVMDDLRGVCDLLI